MDEQRLKQMNRRLADIRGRNPHGEPVYRWFHSRDLRYPARNLDGSYDRPQQIDGERWVIAKWAPPIPEDYEEWKKQFPDIAYPRQGMYYATDTMLVPGVEPSEGITDDVAGRLKAMEGKTFRDFLKEFDDARQSRERESKRVISDVVDDACCAFDHVPGRRGDHVSFGGIDAPKSN